MIELHTSFRKPLHEFVNCFWYSDGASRSHNKERLLPTGAVELIVKLREDRAVRIFDDESNTSVQSFGGTVVSGAYSRHFAIDTTQPSPTLGVHFRPGGAAPFLGIPLSELMDQHLALEEVWGQHAFDLREQLAEASSTPSMFTILERALLDRLTQLPHDYLAIMNAIEKFTSSSPPQVCRP